MTGRLRSAGINLTCPPRQSRQSRRRLASWQLIGSRHCAPAPPFPALKLYLFVGLAWNPSPTHRVLTPPGRFNKSVPLPGLTTEFR